MFSNLLIYFVVIPLLMLGGFWYVTALQRAFSVNWIALVGGRPRLLSLKECVK